MSEQTIDAVEELLSFGNLPPGNFNPFDVRTMSPIFRKEQDNQPIFRQFHVRSETWEKLGELAEIVSRDQDSSISPHQVGSVLLEEVVDDYSIEIKDTKVVTTQIIDEITTDLVPRLTSSGGRPAVPEWTLSRLTGFNPSSWNRLRELASLVSTEERKVSPGQIASFLIEKALAEI